MKGCFRALLFSALPMLAAACLDWSGPVSEDGSEDGVINPELYLDLDLPESDCPFGQAPCGGECVDILSNHSHCGGCSIECEAYEVCSEARCSIECPSGKIGCGGGCVDLSSDINNCGDCGAVCTAGENADPFCDNRVCTVVCRPGWADLDGDGSCESNCIPTSEVETCNGIDDNCDGRVDEGFECRMGMSVSCLTDCGSPGTGVCTGDCRVPPPSQCSPPAEICNGTDDNCNDACDDGFDCCRGETQFCATTCGTSGMISCTSTCMWSACLPPPEICNGSDDDCDGACDNTFECCWNSSGPCTTSCGSQGTRQCAESCQWEACLPPSEICNGLDDDCDGTCDNGLACCAGHPGSCTTSCGSTGSRTCLSNCVWDTCIPPAELCNSLDDDCDSSVDEDFWQYRCPSSGAVNPSRDACNSVCSQTAGCNLVSVSA